jgi:hypothetical protein
MKPILIALAATSFFGTAATARADAIDLTLQKVGAPPQNFQFWRAGQVDFGHWAIVRDVTAQDGSVIQESTPDKADRPSLAIYQFVTATNVKVRTRFKLVAGKRPSAGIAVRVTSPDDYCLVRLSAFEGRLSFIRVKAGVAEEIAGVDAEIALDHWQTLDVVANGNGFTISLDDQWVLTAFDRQAVAEGKTALWTEKDNVVRFDQVELSPLDAVQNWTPRGKRFGLGADDNQAIRSE